MGEQQPSRWQKNKITKYQKLEKTWYLFPVANERTCCQKAIGNASLPSLRTAEKPPSHFRGCMWFYKGEMWSRD